MLGAIPFIHRREYRFILVDGDDRTFGERFERAVRHDRGDLDHPVTVGVEARHLHVYPDEVALVDPGIFAVFVHRGRIA